MAEITQVTVRRSKRGLHTNGMIDWTDKRNIICLHLAQFGLHAKVIAKQTGLTKAQVHNRLAAVGLKLRDYRDGETQPARVIVKKFGVRTIAPAEVKKLTGSVVTPINAI